MPRMQVYLPDDLYQAVKEQRSAVDALVVAVAEPGGDVLGNDLGDLRALAAHATDVRIDRA